MVQDPENYSTKEHSRSFTPLHCQIKRTHYKYQYHLCSADVLEANSVQLELGPPPPPTQLGDKGARFLHDVKNRAGLKANTEVFTKLSRGIKHLQYYQVSSVLQFCTISTHKKVLFETYV